MMFFCETFFQIILVLVNPSLEVIRHSYVQGSISFVCQDINVKFSHCSNTPGFPLARE